MRKVWLETYETALYTYIKPESQTVLHPVTHTSIASWGKLPYHKPVGCHSISHLNIIYHTTGGSVVIQGWPYLYQALRVPNPSPSVLSIG